MELSNIDNDNIEEFQNITEVTSGKSLKSEIGKKHPVYGHQIDRS